MGLIRSKLDRERVTLWIDAILDDLVAHSNVKMEERHRARMDGMLDALLTVRHHLVGGGQDANKQQTGGS